MAEPVHHPGHSAQDTVPSSGPRSRKKAPYMEKPEPYKTTEAHSQILQKRLSESEPWMLFEFREHMCTQSQTKVMQYKDLGDEIYLSK